MTRNELKVWDRFAFMYDFIIKKDKNAYKEIVNQIDQLIKAENKVLEIATGTGIIAIGLSGSVKTMEAVDFSSEMIDIAKKKAQNLGVSNINFSVQDATCLVYEAESFDYVIISNSLHIMPEPQKVLTEIKRVLNKGGKLIAPTFIFKYSTFAHGKCAVSLEKSVVLGNKKVQEYL